jgi:hypothetical protein
MPVTNQHPRKKFCPVAGAGAAGLISFATATAFRGVQERFDPRLELSNLTQRIE